MTYLAAIGKPCIECNSAVQPGDDVTVETRHDSTYSGPIGQQHEVYEHSDCKNDRLQRLREAAATAAVDYQPIRYPKPPETPACSKHACRCGWQWNAKTVFIEDCPLFYRAHVCRVCSRESPKFSALVNVARMRQERRG